MRNAPSPYPLPRRGEDEEAEFGMLPHPTHSPAWERTKVRGDVEIEMRNAEYVMKIGKWQFGFKKMRNAACGMCGVQRRRLVPM
jgi:hypothetical protein